MTPEDRAPMQDRSSAPEMVTIGRAELDAMRERIEELEDLLVSRRVEADLAAGRTEALPIAMLERLINGESPIRVWREHRGIGAAELARRAGMPRSYLSEIEHRRKNGSVELLKKLAGALSVTIDDLT